MKSGGKRLPAHAGSEAELSRKILLVTLLLIIFVSVLGTMMIYSALSGEPQLRAVEGYTNGLITVNVKPPSQQNIKIGETIENNQ